MDSSKLKLLGYLERGLPLQYLPGAISKQANLGLSHLVRLLGFELRLPEFIAARRYSSRRRGENSSSTRTLRLLKEAEGEGV